MNEDLFRNSQIVMYLNLIGILITLVASIFIRRSLIKYQVHLDEDIITNSDYAVYGYDLPKNLPEDKLKSKIEQNFNVKVVFINYCYHIDEFIKSVSRLKELYRLKGIYNNKREVCVHSHLSKNPNNREEDLLNDRTIFPNPILRTGILKKIEIDPEAIQKEIDEI